MSDGSYFMRLRDYYMFERAAYVLARMLGLDNVPPTVIRRFGRNRASLQMWGEYGPFRSIVVPWLGSTSGLTRGAR